VEHAQDFGRIAESVGHDVARLDDDQLTCAGQATGTPEVGGRPPSVPPAADALEASRWLNDRAIHYWGDIDTHGFAILDQPRGHFAHVESFLMDRATLIVPRSTERRGAADAARSDAAIVRGTHLVDHLRWKCLLAGTSASNRNASASTGSSRRWSVYADAMNVSDPQRSRHPAVLDAQARADEA
jgi:hypothetical protein